MRARELTTSAPVPCRVGLKRCWPPRKAISRFARDGARGVVEYDETSRTIPQWTPRANTTLPTRLPSPEVVDDQRRRVDNGGTPSYRTERRTLPAAAFIEALLEQSKLQCRSTAFAQTAAGAVYLDRRSHAASARLI